MEILDRLKSLTYRLVVVTPSDAGVLEARYEADPFVRTETHGPDGCGDTDEYTATVDLYIQDLACNLPLAQDFESLIEFPHSDYSIWITGPEGQSVFCHDSRPGHPKSTVPELR